MRFLVLACVVAAVIFAQDFKLPAPFATPLTCVYFASAGNVVYVCASPAGMRMPNAPI